MENKIKSIWVVQTSNTGLDKDGEVKVNNVDFSYFSTEEKAKTHVAWLKQCAISCDCRFVTSDGLNMKYKLPNGEFWIITTNRKPLDADDMFMS